MEELFRRLFGLNVVADACANRAALRSARLVFVFLFFLRCLSLAVGAVTLLPWTCTLEISFSSAFAYVICLATLPAGCLAAAVAFSAVFFAFACVRARMGPEYSPASRYRMRWISLCRKIEI